MQNFNTTRLASVVAIGAFGLLAACARNDNDMNNDTLATTPPATATTPTTDMNSGWSDGNVVEALEVANRGEVEYSQNAVDKATNPAVKDFAQMMVKDHGALLDSVQALATQLNVQAAANDKTTNLQQEAQKDVQDLNQKTGKEFDEEFMEEQVDMHQETLDLLDDLDGRTTNPQLKAAIASARPKIQAHLDRAKQVKDQID